MTLHLLQIVSRWERSCPQLGQRLTSLPLSAEHHKSGQACRAFTLQLQASASAPACLASKGRHAAWLWEYMRG